MQVLSYVLNMEETKYPMLREVSNDIWEILLSRGSRLLIVASQSQRCLDFDTVHLTVFCNC